MTATCDRWSLSNRNWPSQMTYAWLGVSCVRGTQSGGRRQVGFLAPATGSVSLHINGRSDLLLRVVVGFAASFSVGKGVAVGRSLASHTADLDSYWQPVGEVCRARGNILCPRLLSRDASVQAFSWSSVRLILCGNQTNWPANQKLTWRTRRDVGVSKRCSCS
jgi:hypothetical protein